jgi:hypothetical protein
VSAKNVVCLPGCACILCEGSGGWDRNAAAHSRRPANQCLQSYNNAMRAIVSNGQLCDNQQGCYRSHKH